MFKNIRNVYGGITMNNVASIKAKLKNRAKKEKRLFNEILQIYFLEKFLYRLSISEYKDNFTLKGGILLYALFDEKYSRVTTDIDLLGSGISNSKENFYKIIKSICSIETDDPIYFDLESIQIKTITEFKEYNGINASVIGYLDKTREKVSIDIGFGDVVYPSTLKMDFPTLIDDISPVVNVYSNETIVSEKIEAIVSLGLLNSRLKDFYDVYAISKCFNFNGQYLQQAIIETFHHRHTHFDEIYAFTDEFITPYRKGQWKSFLKKKSPNEQIEFVEAIDRIKIFIEPVINYIIDNRTFHLMWQYKNNCWK